MTQDEIIEMAKQAGLGFLLDAGFMCHQEVKDFANLVAQHEREACLALHDHDDVLAPIGNSAWGEVYQDGWGEGTAAYWKAITARGQA
jgi:hypothetical protein